MNATVKLPFEYQERALVVEMDCDFRCSRYDPGCYSGLMEGSYPAEGGDVEELSVKLLGATEGGAHIPEAELPALTTAINERIWAGTWEELTEKLSSVYIESIHNDPPDYD